MDQPTPTTPPSRLERAAAWLVLPVAALLFLQWPLREWVQAWSREANDIGQWLFAAYVAVAVAAASRARAHIAADALARTFSPATRARLAAAMAVLGLLPWIGWTAWSAGPTVLNSMMQLEQFPDTLNPGYFLVKAALLLLLGAMAIAAVRDIAALVRTKPSPKRGGTP